MVLNSQYLPALRVPTDPVNCPLCGGALELRPALEDQATPTERRREAWAEAEADALLREAQGGPA